MAEFPIPGGRRTSVRIWRLPADRWTDRTRDALKALLPRNRRNPAGAGTAMSTLVRHPDLTEAYLRLGVYMMFQASLPPRVREIAVLRVAARLGCEYIWVHHAEQAAGTGLTEADLEGIALGKLDTPFEQALLDIVDELQVDGIVSDRTWEMLRDHLGEQQRMDLVFAVGCFGMLAMAFNSFGVRPEQ